MEIQDVLADRPFVVLARFDMPAKFINRPECQIGCEESATWIMNRFDKVVKGMTCGGESVECHETRSPYHNTTIKERIQIVNNWHRDAVAPNNHAACFIILWATEICTDLLVFNLDGTTAIIRPEPGSMVLVDNLKCMHRTPGDYDPTRTHMNRWFARWISRKEGKVLT